MVVAAPPTVSIAAAAAALASSAAGPGSLRADIQPAQSAASFDARDSRDSRQGGACSTPHSCAGAVDGGAQSFHGAAEASGVGPGMGMAGEHERAGAEGRIGGLRDLELREKAVSAAAAAVLSAVIVNPLDVAKTRLQAQAAGVAYMPTTWDHMSHRYAAPGKLASLEYKGTFDVMYQVARQEGVLKLWRGTNAALLLAVPTVGIYLPVYDMLKEQLERSPSGQDSPLAPYAPLLAGSISRSLAVVVCSPLELARTRIQAHKGLSGGAGVPGIGTILLDVLGSAREGSGLRSWRSVGVLWTGVGAQLVRDVPFSAICWASLEPARSRLLELAGPDPSLGQILGANFGAGLLAGTLAASVTTPLDVAKTRRQIETDPVKGRQMSTFRTLSQVHREHGLGGLFTGMVPRVGRAAPSVGMVVAFYEIVKHVLRTELTPLAS